MGQSRRFYRHGARTGQVAIDRPAYQRLCAALAVYFGPESMIVFRDVLQMDAAAARKVKSWAVRALVRTALNEAGSK